MIGPKYLVSSYRFDSSLSANIKFSCSLAAMSGMLARGICVPYAHACHVRTFVENQTRHVD